MIMSQTKTETSKQLVERLRGAPQRKDDFQLNKEPLYIYDIPSGLLDCSFWSLLTIPELFSSFDFFDRLSVASSCKARLLWTLSLVRSILLMSFRFWRDKKKKVQIGGFETCTHLTDRAVISHDRFVNSLKERESLINQEWMDCISIKITAAIAKWICLCSLRDRDCTIESCYASHQNYGYCRGKMASLSYELELDIVHRHLLLIIQNQLCTSFKQNKRKWYVRRNSFTQCINKQTLDGLLCIT